jgi:hypothetical protein
MKRFLETFSKTDIGNILGVIITLGVFILMYLLIIKPIPVENKDIVMTAVGFVFGGALSGVIGYFYGASKTTTQVNSPNSKSDQ